MRNPKNPKWDQVKEVLRKFGFTRQNTYWYSDSTSPKKNKYRLKLTHGELSKSKIQKLENSLKKISSDVIEVKNITYYSMGHRSLGYPGHSSVAIYFKTQPSLIS